MSLSMFYSLNTMTVAEWFNMLNHEGKPQEEEDGVEQQEQEPVSYIYEVRAENSFSLNSEAYDAGLYFMRTSAQSSQKLPSFCHVRKLSFSELVHLSDIFSLAIATLIPDADDLKNLVDSGEAAQYFKTEIASIPSEGLMNMREKVWAQYFDQGMMGRVRRFFSALANFFRKYYHYIETDIYWPGNSCIYADKVVDQMNRMKAVFIRIAYKASKEVVSDCLGISVEELKNMDPHDLKKIYQKKITTLHPDKNKGDLLAVDEFKKVNVVWKDYIELANLSEKYQDGVYDDTEDEFNDSPYENLADKKNLVVKLPLAAHQFKTLSLPAPISI